MIHDDFLRAVHEDHLRLAFVSGNCERCRPPSWHDDARNRRLRPMVVGGVPFDPHERPGAEPQGVAPTRIAGDPGVTVADVVAVPAAASRVDQPDGDLAGSRRAIASATPGRTHPPTPRRAARPLSTSFPPDVDRAARQGARERLQEQPVEETVPTAGGLLQVPIPVGS